MPNRLKTIEQLKDNEGVRYYKNPIYPDVPVTEDDYYVIATGGDRYDILAQQFYGDREMWWVIAIANNSKKDSIVVEQGTQLRIPADPNKIKALFVELNKKR